MRKILAATLLATVAFTGTPASAGCVEDLLVTQRPEEVVERHPDGSVTVHPNRAVNNTLYHVGKAGAFVDCVI